jgi:hypothetical protein
VLFDIFTRINPATGKPDPAGKYTPLTLALDGTLSSSDPKYAINIKLEQ